MDERNQSSVRWVLYCIYLGFNHMRDIEILTDVNKAWYFKYKQQWVTDFDISVEILPKNRYLFRFPVHYLNGTLSDEKNII